MAKYIPPQDCSYFEAMCLEAEHGFDEESRGHAQYEVDRMVEANNKALETDMISKVRELTEHINEEVRGICDSLHFCSNDSLTRIAAKSHAIQILSDLKANRHIADFIVTCDETNNTPYRIDRNELWIDIQFKMHDGRIYLAGGNTVLSKATAPVGQITIDDDDDSIITTGVIGGGGYGSSGGQMILSGGGGIGVGTGILSSGVNGSYSMNSIGSMVGQLTLDVSMSQVDELPTITFNGHDFDEKKIAMILKPESTISTLEVFKIMLLINAAHQTPRAFSVYAYIKKNNLERHFKFTQ